MPASEPIDERLRDLLAVEQRLQRLVAAARADADRRVADARAAATRLLTDADTAVTRADAEQAGLDEAAHAQAQRALEERHRAVIASLTSISVEDRDRLARRALARVLEPDGGSS